MNVESGIFDRFYNISRTDDKVESIQVKGNSYRFSCDELAKCVNHNTGVCNITFTGFILICSHFFFFAKSGDGGND